MKPTVLITGGAGFIGSHLADELINNGYSVRVLDNLTPQLHGPSATKPDYLNENAEFIYGDIRDEHTVDKALKGIDAVFHLAAAVGVGQSMYEIQNYVSTNNLGTAVLLQKLIDSPVKKLIVASSMSIYGEGLYKNTQGRLISDAQRDTEQLKQNRWELTDQFGDLQPAPTPESKTPSLSSIYALSKYDQERMCLLTGKAYGIPTVALRFFNVYGTRQALSNPYTGVLAIFASRYLNGNAPIVYEDGQQKRDFVHVYDIARACRSVLENDKASDAVYNVASGNSYSIFEIAKSMAAVLQKEQLTPKITGKYRVGDIRHCFADISKIQNEIGYQPRITLEKGLSELADWLCLQKSDDRCENANHELHRRGLTI